MRVEQGLLCERALVGVGDLIDSSDAKLMEPRLSRAMVATYLVTATAIACGDRRRVAVIWQGRAPSVTSLQGGRAVLASLLVLRHKLTKSIVPDAVHLLPSVHRSVNVVDVNSSSSNSTWRSKLRTLRKGFSALRLLRSCSAREP